MRIDDLLTLIPKLSSGCQTQVLKLVYEIADKDQRVHTLCKLIPFLPTDLQLDAITVTYSLIHEIADKDEQVCVLCELIPLLPANLQQEAIFAIYSLIYSIKEVGTCRFVLRTLISHPSADLQHDIFAVLAGSVSDDYRFVAEIASYLPSNLQTKVIKEALKAMGNIAEHDDEDFNALRALAPLMSEELLEEAVMIGLAIKDECARGVALSVLGPFLSFLPSGIQAKANDGMLNTSREILVYFQQKEFWESFRTRDSLFSVMLAMLPSHEDICSNALCKLIEALPFNSRITIVQEAFDVVRRIPYLQPCEYLLKKLVPYLSLSVKLQEDMWHWVLETNNDYSIFLSEILLPYLSPKLQESVFDHVRVIVDETKRADALRIFAALPNEILQLKAIAMGRRLTDQTHSIDLLCAFIPHLSVELQIRVWIDILNLISEIGDEAKYVQVLRDLVTYLPAQLHIKVLSIGANMMDETHRVSVLQILASSLAPELHYDALNLAYTVSDKSKRAEALQALAANLSPKLQIYVVEEAFALARRIDDSSVPINFLCALAPYLPNELQTGIINNVLVQLSRIDNVPAQARILHKLASYCSPDAFVEKLSLAHKIDDKTSRVEALIALTPHLPKTMQNDIIKELFTITRELFLHSPRGRLYATGLILSNLATDILQIVLEDLIKETLELVHTKIIDAPDIRGEVMLALAPHLSPYHLEYALIVARDISNEFQRILALSGLIPFLPKGLQSEVLKELQDLEQNTINHSERIRILCALAPLLPPSQQVGTLLEAINLTLNSTSEGNNKIDILSHILAVWERLNFIELRNNKSLWPKILHTVAAQPRPKLLEDLALLVPMVHHLGNDDAIREIYLAFKDVIDWWP